MKRKYDSVEPDENDTIHKKGVMGRPKNAWNPSRSRKLVRLYLMSSLSVDEIVEVIRTKDFMPCKRDVQKQLQTLLQSRPSKIRSRGAMTKVRLHLFRECRTMMAYISIRISRESEMHGNFDENVRRGQEKLSDLSEFTDASPGFYPLDWNTSSFITEKVDSSCISVEALPSTSDVLTQAALYGGTPQPMVKTTPPRRPNAVTTTITAGDVPNGLMNVPSEESMDGRRYITFKTESCQASIVSIDSLRNQLASKTESFIGDVISVIQNLTISGSTNASSKLRANGSWKGSSRTSFIGSEASRESSDNETITAVAQVPFISQQHVVLEHELLLPGYLAIRPSKPVKFAKGPSALWRRANDTFTWAENRLGNARVYDAKCIKIDEVDPFGHTGLHTAAASGQRPKVLLNLINQGADLRALNSGGETFLHLVKNICHDDYLYLGHLLLRLQMEGFDFCSRDNHGQTPFHILTRQWVDKAALEGIAKNLLSHEITIPRSRDNLGRTVVGQMIDVGLEIAAIRKFKDRALASENSTNHKIGYQENDTGCTVPVFQLPKHCLLNYGAHTYIETVEDIQKYEAHADLLRTILNASSYPQYEDDNGRNGLHCLATVSLNLPVPSPLPSSEADESTRREAYLTDLLEAGVDPGNCDKEGNSPLMAFIIHTRADEDDQAVTRILARLYEAGANFDRRDRMGQTPLHLSVSLGRTAATRFLLTHGANVHARDSKGRGIIALGKLKSDKTSGDAKLYAHIMMCISSVADAGGVSAPTFEQEWGQK